MKLFRRFRIDLVLGIILPIGLGFAYLWKTMLTPGLTFHGDQGPNFNLLPFTILPFENSWYYELSSPAGSPLINFLGVLPLGLPLLLGLPDEASLKIWFLLNYALSGTFVYFSVRMLVPKPEKNAPIYYLSCVLAAMFYMSNRLIITILHVPVIGLAYSAIPLFAASFVKAINNERILSKYLLLSLFALLYTWQYPPAFFYAVMFAFLYFLYSSFKRRVACQVIHTLITVVALFFMFVALAADLILPMIWKYLFAPQQLATLYAPSAFSVEELYKLWKHGYTAINQLTLTVDFLGYWPYFSPYLKAFSLLIPLMAFSALLLRYRENSLRKTVLWHGLLAVLTLMFAVRDSPFIDIVAVVSGLIWNSDIIFRGALWSFVKQPHIFELLLVYLFSFLASMFVYGLLSRLAFRLPSSHPRKMAAFSLVLLITSTSMAPWLFSIHEFIGDLGGQLEPAELPPNYRRVSHWIQQNNPNNLRTLWLPLELGFVSFNWTKIGSHMPASGGMPYVWGSEVLRYWYLQEVLVKNSSNIGEILKMLGGRYVVLHLDTLPQTGIYDEGQRALKALMGDETLRLVHRDGFIYVFEVTGDETRSYSFTNIALLVGGYNTLFSLENVPGINQYAIVFAYQLPPSTLKDIIERAELIVLNPHTSIYDLIFLTYRNYTYYPSEYLEDAKGWTSISSDSLYLYYLHRISVERGLFFNWEGDFLLSGSGVLSNDASSKISVPVVLSLAEPYELWIRVLKSPVGGTLSLSIGGKVYNLNTTAEEAFFEWVKLTDIIGPRKDNLTITNVNGLNCIDAIVIMPKGIIDSLRSNCTKILSGKDVILVDRAFYADKLVVDQDAWAPQGDGGEWVAGEHYVAQTFTPQQSNLSAIELVLGYRNATKNPANLEILLTPAFNGTPDTSKVLARTTIDYRKTAYYGGFPVMIPLRYENLTVGKTYAIVLRQEGNAGIWQESDYMVAFKIGQYNNGNFFTSANAGKTWERAMYGGGISHIIFRTYYTRTEITHKLSEAHFSKTMLYSVNLTTNRVNRLKGLTLKAPNGVNIINFAMPYPGKYEVTVNASKPFIMIIPEKYDPLWQANIEDALHLPILSTINGYYINRTGLLKISFEYSLNKPFEVGRWFSIISILGIIVLLPIVELRRKVKR